MEKQLSLKGVIPPMISPLTSGGEVDVPATEKLVSHLIGAGVSGIFVLGSSGEGPWLTAAKQRQVVETAVRAAAGRVPVLVGVLEPSTERVLEGIEAVQQAGGDGVVVTTPYYFATDDAAVFRHLEAAARASELPTVLYNIPQMTHNTLSVPVVRDLLTLDNVIAIKDSAGDFDRFSDLLHLKKERAGFSVLQGAEKMADKALLAGADGVVPGLANIAPELFVGMVERAAAGDRVAVERLQQQALALWELHTHGFWLACLKYAASVKGFGSGATSGENGLLAEEARAHVRQLVKHTTAVPVRG